MRCSNCELWITDRCHIHPNTEDWDNAESCAYFVPATEEDWASAESYAPITESTIDTKISYWGVFFLGLGFVILMISVLFMDLAPNMSVDYMVEIILGFAGLIIGLPIGVIMIIIGLYLIYRDLKETRVNAYPESPDEEADVEEEVR